MSVHPRGILIQNVFLEQGEIAGRLGLIATGSFAILPGVGGRFSHRPSAEVLP